jgi:hypothetical protein
MPYSTARNPSDQAEMDALIRAMESDRIDFVGTPDAVAGSPPRRQSSLSFLDLDQENEMESGYARKRMLSPVSEFDEDRYQPSRSLSSYRGATYSPNPSASYRPPPSLAAYSANPSSSYRPPPSLSAYSQPASYPRASRSRSDCVDSSSRPWEPI